MPIANCIVTPKCQNGSGGSGNLIELWSSESKISSEHMTINIITSNEQLGNKYTIMATLLLPSIWSNSNVSSLQIGLAKALASHFKVSLKEVFISTNIVNSGMVVESGKEVKW
jgi:hypothetical protein